MAMQPARRVHTRLFPVALHLSKLFELHGELVEVDLVWGRRRTCELALSRLGPDGWWVVPIGGFRLAIRLTG